MIDDLMPLILQNCMYQQKWLEFIQSYEAINMLHYFDEL